MVAPAENPQQDTLFDIDIEYLPSGVPDPLGYQPKIVTNIVLLNKKDSSRKDSRAGEEPVAVAETEVVTGAVQKLRNRSAEQAGRHSPLQRTGSYADAEPGDFLPGFGVVRYANLDEAREFGARLDHQRRVPRPRRAGE